MSTRSAMFLALASLLVACGGAGASVPEDQVPGGAGTGTGVEEAAPSGPTAPAAPAPAPGDGPSLTFRAGGSTTPFPHADGLSGQDALVQVAAIKSLFLLRSEGDPAPVKVFDHGASPVLVDYTANTPVTLAVVPRATIPSGTYRRAKVGVAYVRYRVPARLHGGLVPLDGAYDNVQALSDGAVIDGTARARGWHRYAFVAGTSTVGAVEGANAPLPVSPKAGGVTLETSGPEAFYVFDIDAAYDATATYRETVTLEANVSRAFRWQDQTWPGFSSGVFDTTISSFEPVMAFGVNAYRVTFAREP